MKIQIADWGMELSFVSTAIGKELAVASALTAQNEGGNCTYFQSYGYFDLAAFNTIRCLDSPYLVLLHPDITESAPFRFFADKNTPLKAFEQAISSWRASIAVMIKIRAWNKPSRGDERWVVAQQIREQFTDAFVLFGLGFSELLFLSGSDDLAALLRRVGQLRVLTAPGSTSAPLFSKTTTIPLVAYSLLKRSEYSRLKGEVEPVVSVSCAPSAERTIARDLSQQKIVTKNVFGKNDLLLAWLDKISVSALTEFVSEFRKKWGEAGVLVKTTTYLETAIDDSGEPLVTVDEFVSGETSTQDIADDALFQKLHLVEPNSLKAALSDLVLRLMTCLRDPQLSDYYLDMVNTFEYVQDLVENSSNSSNRKIVLQKRPKRPPPALRQ